MATIQETIQLNDGISGPLNKIANLAERAAGAGQRLADRIQSVGHSSSSARGSVNSLGSSVGDLVGQFTLANIASEALIRTFDALSGAPAKLAAAADQFAGMQARLKLVTGSQEKANELNDMIYQSALRARGSYNAMADSVAKIGMTAKEAFPDPKQIVPFMEGIQKLFTIGGTGVQQQADAMLQLTQALGSGKLQGDEFRSIAEAAPMIEQMVARYMGVAQGQLKELASEGEITADIMKNAILQNLDEIDRQFKEMPLTWGNVWQQMETVATKAFWPVLKMVEELAGSEGVKSFGQVFAGAMQLAAQATMWVINNALWLASVIAANADIIVPILATIAGLIIANGLAAAGASAIAAAGAIAHAVASGMETAAIIALTFAQEGLNAAIAMCPVSWILMAIVALIGVFYLVVAAVNRFAGTSISATGIIFAVFAWLGTSIMNIVKMVANMFIAFANFLGSVFQDPAAATYNLFADIWNGIVGLVESAVNSIIDMINAIPGIDKVMGKVGHVDGLTLERKEVAEAVFHIDPFEYGNAAFNAAEAYDYGSNISNPLDALKGMAPSEAAETNYKDVIGPAIAAAGNPDNDKNGKKTADNTGRTAEAAERMADKISMTDEEMKELREVTLQSTLNQWQDSHNIEIHIDQQNTVSGDTDIDGMTSSLVEGLREALDIHGERPTGTQYA